MPRLAKSRYVSVTAILPVGAFSCQMLWNWTTIDACEPHGSRGRNVSV
jgi:hypothetical protein